jgi:hypothetical protein
MNVGSDWYSGVAKKIKDLKENLPPMDSAWYKFVSSTSTPTTRLDPLLSAAQRIDQFSPDCTQCQMFRDDINTLMRNAPDAAQHSDKELVRSFLNDVDRIVVKITSHLRKEHKLVTSGYYKSLFGVLGYIIGIVCQYVFGYVFRSYFFLWPYVGIGLGLVIGAFLDAKAKREDRILYKQAPARFSKNTPIIIVVVVVITFIIAMIFAFRF